MMAAERNDLGYHLSVLFIGGNISWDSNGH
jgi:hypothetical protein